MKVWILQTGEPLQIDGENVRPMRAINLSNMLIRYGHDVTIWSSDFYHQKKTHRYNTKTDIKVSDKLTIRLIPSCGYKHNISIARLIDHVQLSRNLKNYLKQYRELPDVAFIGYPPIETSFVFTNWLKRRGVPTLLDVKDQWPDIFVDALPKPIRPFGQIIFYPYFYMARKIMKEVTGISSMADGFLNWALKNVNRKKTVNDKVFPLTTKSRNINKIELEIARKWWDENGILNNGTPRVFFVGSVSRAFDFEPIFEAARYYLFNNMKCEFVICGEGELTSVLKKKANGLSNIFFAGWINRPQIEALAERSIASLAPYLNIANFITNIPNKIIDSLSLGIPILCPLKGEVENLIKTYKVGLQYSNKRGKSLFDCINTLIINSKLQNEISINSRKLYEKHFSFEKVYISLVKHLEMMAHAY